MSIGTLRKFYWMNITDFFQAHSDPHRNYSGEKVSYQVAAWDMFGWRMNVRTPNIPRRANSGEPGPLVAACATPQEVANAGNGGGRVRQATASAPP